MDDRFIKIGFLFLLILFWGWIIFVILFSVKKFEELKVERPFGAISEEDQKKIDLMDKVINKQQLTMDEYKKVIALYDAEIKTDRTLVNFKGDINTELSKKIKNKIMKK